MNFEDLQKSWQHQETGGKISINADLLLKEVRRNQQQFRATIFWRDVREVGTAFLLTPLFCWLALWQHDWTNYLIALACFGVGTFMVVDRLRQRNTSSALHESLKHCVETSLVEVRHQVWLLKNVFWWYLLPIAASLLFSVCWSECRSAKAIGEKWIDLLVSVGVVALINWGLYWVNQYAVKESLEPRRRELEKLMASLE